MLPAAITQFRSQVGAKRSVCLPRDVAHRISAGRTSRTGELTDDLRQARVRRQRGLDGDPRAEQRPTQDRPQIPERQPDHHPTLVLCGQADTARAGVDTLVQQSGAQAM